MDWLNTIKSWIGALTEVALMLIALAISLALLAGANVPFFQNTTGNIVTFVNDLSKAGLVGLLVLGFILWLFSHRKIT
jgi:phosphotransferase system  glucose/maltose/N-acetylglucosamine-specific IIC component